MTQENPDSPVSRPERCAVCGGIVYRDAVRRWCSNCGPEAVSWCGSEVQTSFTS